MHNIHSDPNSNHEHDSKQLVTILYNHNVMFGIIIHDSNVIHNSIVFMILMLYELEYCIHDSNVIRIRILD